MHIAVACAGRRGYQVLRRLVNNVPGAEFTVFSFREEKHEPAFLEDIGSLAASAGGVFLESRRIDRGPARSYLESHDTDLMLVIGWRYLVQRCAYSRPKRGTFVFHDSLLPRYRGFSPTVWAMQNGEDCTGATLFKIADDVDSGDIVDQRRVPIWKHDTIADVIHRVTESYVELLEGNLESLLNGTATLQPQNHSLATYGRKRIDEDRRIQWEMPAQKIYDLIRAVTKPYPGAVTQYQAHQLRVWKAQPVRLPNLQLDVEPGTVMYVLGGNRYVVTTGTGMLLLEECEWQSPVMSDSQQLQVNDRLG